MHQERTRDPDQVDAAILELLRDPGCPWSVEEVGRAIGSQLEAADSIARLTRAGLCHRLSDFVWATRAALHSGWLKI